MQTRRDVLALAGAVTASGLAGCTGDAGQQTTTRTATTTAMSTDLTLSTAAFDDGGLVPEKYTCDGADVSPPLSIGDAPDGAQAFALVVDDPDAPGGTFTHWLLWNLPADVASIQEGVPRSETVDGLGGAAQGTNDFDEVGYRGPCPPRGDGPHTYRFTLYALDGDLDVPPGAKKRDLMDAVGGATVAQTRITAEYER